MSIFQMENLQAAELRDHLVAEGVDRDAAALLHGNYSNAVCFRFYFFQSALVNAC